MPWKRIALSALGLWLAGGLAADTSLARSPEDRPFSFTFEPSKETVTGIPPLRICILPLANTSDGRQHVNDPEKAFRNLGSGQYERVLGFRFSAAGKLRDRFSTGSSFERILGEALVLEVTALGMEIVTPPASTSPPRLEPASLIEAIEDLPAAQLPQLVLAGTIKNFHFQARTFYKKLGWNTTSEVKFRVLANFVLDVMVLDVEASEILWEGRITSSDQPRDPEVGSKQKVMSHVNRAFRDLIEGVLRNNTELQEKLDSTR